MNTNMTINDKFFRNVRKTDWELFAKKVDEGMKIISDNGLDLETQAEYLNKVILNAYYESCKQSRVGNGEDPPWWTHELKQMKTQLNNLRRRNQFYI